MSDGCDAYEINNDHRCWIIKWMKNGVSNYYKLGLKARKVVAFHARYLQVLMLKTKHFCVQLERNDEGFSWFVNRDVCSV